MKLRDEWGFLSTPLLRHRSATVKLHWAKSSSQSGVRRTLEFSKGIFASFAYGSRCVSGQHTTYHVLYVQEGCLSQPLKHCRGTYHDSVDSDLIISQSLAFDESSSESLEGMKDLDAASHHTGRSGVGLGCAGNHWSSRMRYLPQNFAEKKIIPLRQPSSFQLRYESLFFHVEGQGHFSIFEGFSVCVSAGYLDFTRLKIVGI